MPLDLAKIYAATPLPKRLNPLQMMQLSEDARKSGRERLQQQIVGYHAGDPRATSAALAKHGFGEQSRAWTDTADQAKEDKRLDRARNWNVAHSMFMAVETAGEEAERDGRNVEQARQNVFESVKTALISVYEGEGESPFAALEYENYDEIMYMGRALKDGEIPSGFSQDAFGNLTDQRVQRPTIEQKQTQDRALTAQKIIIEYIMQNRGPEETPHEFFKKVMGQDIVPFLPTMDEKGTELKSIKDLWAIANKGAPTPEWEDFLRVTGGLRTGREHMEREEGTGTAREDVGGGGPSVLPAPPRPRPSTEETEEKGWLETVGEVLGGVRRRLDLGWEDMTPVAQDRAKAVQERAGGGATPTVPPPVGPAFPPVDSAPPPPGVQRSQDLLSDVDMSSVEGITEAAREARQSGDERKFTALKQALMESLEVNYLRLKNEAAGGLIDQAVYGEFRRNISAIGVFSGNEMREIMTKFPR
jgi:hypothetical protein